MTKNIIRLKNQKYKAEYNDLEFNSRIDFEKWLKEITKYTITFEDEGQDCLTWYIDDGGEVLHASSGAFIWNGMIVSLYNLKVGKNIEVMKVAKRANQVLSFMVKKIS